MSAYIQSMLFWSRFFQLARHANMFVTYVKMLELPIRSMVLLLLLAGSQA